VTRSALAAAILAVAAGCSRNAGSPSKSSVAPKPTPAVPAAEPAIPERVRAAARAALEAALYNEPRYKDWMWSEDHGDVSACEKKYGMRPGPKCLVQLLAHPGPPVTFADGSTGFPLVGRDSPLCAELTALGAAASVDHARSRLARLVEDLQGALGDWVETQSGVIGYGVAGDYAGATETERRNGRELERGEAAVRRAIRDLLDALAAPK